LLDPDSEMVMIRRLLVLAAAALSACHYPIDPDLQSGTVRWGTSFGMCVGYCRQELSIVSTQLQLTRTSWDAQHNPPRVDQQNFQDADWRQLLAKVDADKIRGLNDVYGCPDCADGGAEWVELEGPGIHKKVTFEYNKPPRELEEAVTALRGLRTRFAQ
jgi:hypothetical protein